MEIVELSEWQTRSLPGVFLNRSAQAAANALHGRLAIRELRSGLEIEAKSFVGTVRLGDLTIHVHPKLSAAHIPPFMRYALSFDSVTLLPQASVPAGAHGFVDLVAVMLLEVVDRLIHGGLAQEYHRTRQVVPAPRGRIRFVDLARRPPQDLALPCQYDRRTPAIALNRVAIGALGLLRPLVRDRGLSFELHTREATLQDFCGSATLSHHLLQHARTSLDRRTAHYEPLLRLADLLLASQGPVFLSQDDTPLPGFLFDMNLLFERFVARLCADYADLRIDPQHATRNAYHYVANPHHWLRPALRPDIVMRDAANRPVMILDTKYKSLGTSPPSPADLYQLTLYSLTHGGVPAILVHPSDVAAEPILQLKNLATVAVRGLDLARCAEALRTHDEPGLKTIVRDLLRHHMS